MPSKSEIGRELKAEELRSGTVVFTNPEHRPELYASLWVERIDPAMIWLLSALPGQPEVHLGLFRQPDGTLKDDGGRRIRIFEYLGKP